MADLSTDRIEIIQGAGRPKARIVGHRIRVRDVVVWHEELGMALEEIVQHYPSITLADVQAALEHYRDHRIQIDKEIFDERAYVEEFQRGHTSLLAEKLKHRCRG